MICCALATAQQHLGQTCSSPYILNLDFIRPTRVSAQPPTINPATCNAGYQAVVSVQGIEGGLENTTYHIRILDEKNALVASQLTQAASALLQVGRPGNFIVHVTDSSAAGCPGVDSPLQLNPLPAMTIDAVSTTDNLCTEGKQGQISVQYPESFTEARVLLYDSTSKEVPSAAAGNPWRFQQLPSGDYTVVLRRSGACADQTSTMVTVARPPKMAVSLNVSPISCKDSADAAMVAIVNDFGRSYDLAWLHNGAVFNSLDESVTGLAPGKYQFVTLPRSVDNVACPEDADTITAHITEPTRALATVTHDSLLCLDPPINKLKIGQMQGGSDVFNILVHKNSASYLDKKYYKQADLEIDTLSDGAYEVWVTDAMRPSCPGFYQKFQIDPVEPLALNASVLQHNACYGDREGQISISWEGKKARFHFTDTRGINTFTRLVEDNATFTIDSLTEGTYTVSLSRNAGCSEAVGKTLIITAPEPIRFDYVKKDIDCYGQPTGEISGFLSGGTGGYRWQWSRNGTLTEYAGTEPDTRYTKLIEGRYVLDVEDDALCKADFAIDIVPLAQELLVSLDATDISCRGAADGMVRANISGGSLPYRLLWQSNNHDLSGNAQQWPIPAPDTVSVQVVDDKGCHAYDTVSIHEPPPFHFPDYFRLCNDQPYKARAHYPENDVVFAWESNNGFYAYTPDVILRDAGQYTVSAIRPNGCTNTEAFEVAVLKVDFMASFLGASWVEVGDTIYLKEISRPRPDSVFWDFSEGLAVTIDTLGDPLISASVPGEYQVGMYAYKDSCMTYTTKTFSYFAAGQAPELLGDDIFGPKGIERFVVMPNPSDGRFDIEIGMYKPEPVALFLYDMQGKERWRGIDEDPKITYNFSVENTVLEPGTYVLMAVSKNARKTLKVIVR